MDYRRKLWLNILEDLGPPEGCILPLWLRMAHTLIFPVFSLQVLLGRASGFDPYTATWTIHGIQFSDRLFVRLAVANGSLYRFTTKNGILTVERVTVAQGGEVEP